MVPIKGIFWLFLVSSYRPRERDYVLRQPGVQMARIREFLT